MNSMQVVGIKGSDLQLAEGAFSHCLHFTSEFKKLTASTVITENAPAKYLKYFSHVFKGSSKN